jgi:hypothetical protein
MDTPLRLSTTLGRGFEPARGNPSHRDYSIASGATPFGPVL